MAATDADARANGFATPAGTELISGGDDAIRQNARAAVDLHALATRWQAVPAPAGAASALPLGAYIVADPSTVTGLPSGAPAGLLNRQESLDEYTTAEPAATVWQRRKIGGLWNPWAIYSREIITPHHLTRPQATLTETTTSRSVRIPFNVPAAVRRWRVVIRNINYRTNTKYPGAVTLDTVAVGGQARNANGVRTSSFAPVAAFPSGLRLLASDVAVADMGEGWASGWGTDPLTPGIDYMMSFGYLTNGQAVQLSMGGGWQTSGNPGNAGLTSDSTAAAATRLPFDVRLELVTTDGTRQDVIIGDSISAGSNATLPVLEAPARTAGTNMGRLARLHTFGGAAFGEWIGVNWGDPASLKWQEITGAGRADRAVIALGSNDIHAGTDLTTMKANFAALAALLRERVSPQIVACTVTPRTAWTGTAKESVRVAFNDWVRSHPEGITAVADTARAVEDATGHAPRTEYVATDGIHFNSAGSTALAGAVASPAATSLADLAAPAPDHVHGAIDNGTGRLGIDASGGLQHSVGGVRKWWIDENGTLREGTVPWERVGPAPASGLRNVSALFGVTGGSVLLEVRDGSVWLYWLGVTLAGSGNIDLTSNGLSSIAPQSPVTSHNLDLLAGAATTRRLQITEFGYVRLYAYATGEVLNGTVSYPMTRPHPTVWPGDPA